MIHLSLPSSERGMSDMRPAHICHKKPLMQGMTRPEVSQKFGMDLLISSPYSIVSKEAKRSLIEKQASEEKQR